MRHLLTPVPPHTLSGYTLPCYTLRAILRRGVLVGFKHLHIEWPYSYPPIQIPVISSATGWHVFVSWNLATPPLVSLLLPSLT